MNCNNSEFFQFLSLCGTKIDENLNTIAWINKFNKFNSYCQQLPKAELAYHFIKWQQHQSGGYSLPQQINEEPPEKKLIVENITQPKSLPENNIGTFTTFSFEINEDPVDIYQREITNEAKFEEKIEVINTLPIDIDNFIPNYPDNLEADPLNMIGLIKHGFDIDAELLTTNINVPQHHGKDVSMAKKIYDEENKKNDENCNYTSPIRTSNY
ncbi:Hypothetical predicted protein [Paramuricea clavata]|uniref:Uncharacterized protein n=1 Tax=Paramuricea clavata TaxID=317549 RepID=A0A7D9EJQ8_PARCT|nr:Hypothetical predicted protein [Paramuricea clavata]